MLLPVSVVVPTRDRPARVRDLVASVLAGSTAPAEIVVADQSREPQTLDARTDGGSLVHLHLEEVGLSRGRNAGIDAAQHDLLVFVDDDIIVDTGWLARLVGALEAAPARTIVTGAVLATEAPGITPSVTSGSEPRVFSGRPGLDPLFPNNMAMWRSTVTEVGPFDVRLGAGAQFASAEDNDFGFRALEAGYRIEFVPDAVVWHLGARSGSDRRRLEWSYGRGQGGYYAKHFRIRDPYMVRQFCRNVAGRLRHPKREGVYLVALLLGTADWLIRYRLLDRTSRRASRAER